MIKPKIPIAHEGYPFIAIAAFLSLVFSITGLNTLLLLSLLATAFITYFFRDPERFVPADSNLIISPADGKVIVIEEVTDERFTHQDAIKISIFMNVFNVHVNRAPLSGTVEKIIYRPGKFYSADSVKGAEQNEYCGIVLNNSHGFKIACVQVAGLIARRIVCYLEQGDTIAAGRRFGLIRFGSRVDLYLPRSMATQVKIGQKVIAGETILATIPPAE